MDLSWSILGMKHVFLDPWFIPIESCFHSFWVIILLNSDLKLPLWEQNLTIFQLHLHFFGSLMINFVSETCTFRSLINTDWISFSILLGHNVVQFRSETAIMRAEFNDFPTSYAFFWSFSINFRSETCNVWILDTYQLDIVVKYFGSLFCSIQIWKCHYENRIYWVFNFICIFWIFHDQFLVWKLYFQILVIYRLYLVFNLFGSLCCSIQIWNCHYESRV